jgi:hypothetical protein
MDALEIGEHYGYDEFEMENGANYQKTELCEGVCVETPGTQMSNNNYSQQPICLPTKLTFINHGHQYPQVVGVITFDAYNVCIFKFRQHADDLYTADSYKIVNKLNNEENIWSTLLFDDEINVFYYPISIKKHLMEGLEKYCKIGKTLPCITPKMYHCRNCQIDSACVLCHLMRVLYPINVIRNYRDNDHRRN